MNETSYVYDDFSQTYIDLSKWGIIEIPLPDGGVWRYEEPNAHLEVINKTLRITVNPFTRKNDALHALDDPKHALGSTKVFKLKEGVETIFELDMAAENHGGNSNDIQDGLVSFNVVDLSSAMVFDFVATSTKIGAIYERLFLPGITEEKLAFTYLVQSPFCGVTTSPRQFHNYKVILDGTRKKAIWYLDGMKFFAAENLPASISNITIGMGLLTLKPIIPGKGSVSLHGQGATGWWRNVKITDRSSK